MNFTKNPLFYLSLVLALIVGLQAWNIVGAQIIFQEPTNAFPASNVSAPIETGELAQTKRGVLSFAPALDPFNIRVSIGPDGLHFIGGPSGMPTWKSIMAYIGGGVGPKGDPGDPGDPGPKGDTGDTGDTGDEGDPGGKGDTGDEGDPGGKGDPGPAGFIGWIAGSGNTLGEDYHDPTGAAGISYGYSDGGTGWGDPWGTYLTVRQSDYRMFQMYVGPYGDDAYLRAYYEGSPSFGWTSWSKFILEGDAGDVDIDITGNFTVGGTGMFPTGLKSDEKQSSCLCTPSYPSCDSGNVSFYTRTSTCGDCACCGVTLRDRERKYRTCIGFEY